jgi:predicted dehydrogenase
MSINWGIIGTGHMASKFAQVMSNKSGHRALAIFSRSKTHSDIFARKFGIPISCNSIHEFLNVASIDAVYVATPHATHFEFSSQALSYGKAVLCEKPLYFTENQFDVISKLSMDYQCLFMESLGFVLNPNFQRTLEFYKSDQIGELTSSLVTFSKDMDVSKQNRITNLDLGGGVLNEMGSYPISLAYFLCGKPIFSQIETTKNSLDLDIAVNGLLGFTNNRTFQFTCSFISSDESIARISGRKGDITLNHPFYLANSLTLRKSGAIPKIYHEPMANPNNLHFVLDHFQQLFHLGELESDLISLNDSRIINEILTQLRD